MNAETPPILYWFRRDLRLADHVGLTKASRTGRPVIPVFIHDDLTGALGAASKWRLGQGLKVFSATLQARGSRLTVRRGRAIDVLRRLIGETGAQSVWWTRAYDPASIRRDREIKKTLLKDGMDARSFPGHLLFEPWTVATKSGGFFRVYLPMWRAVRDRYVAEPLSVPTQLLSPPVWPTSEDLTDWRLDQAMQRGAAIVSDHARPGEAAALDRLTAFAEDDIRGYAALRDRPDLDVTSNLSEYLSLGEIGPRQIWHRGQRALAEGHSGAEQFLKELVWREFAYHLMYHSPELLSQSWKPGWDGFPWQTDAGHPHVRAWMRGRTGIPLVDAGMRQMYVTGRMHNRVRMVVASYLTKHLMSHWKIGMDWFANHLTDWDPASNAMGWQWVAGSGPDAAPYFRIFNPEAQQARFDPDGRYVRRWISEGQAKPAKTASSYFRAIPPSWGMSSTDPYPAPVVPVDAGRRGALAAYKARDF